MGNEGRVLVADDTVSLRRFLEHVLQLNGWETCGIGHAAELDATVARFDPQVVLLDWTLEDVKAEEVIAALHDRGIAVIVITGDPYGVTATGVPVIPKPVDLDNLLRLLAEAVSRP